MLNPCRRVVDHVLSCSNMIADLRFAARGIGRNPGFAILIVLTMALGIGANTAMFGVIRAVFLRPLPFPAPERLVTIWEGDPERSIVERRLTPANFVDWEARNSVFEAMGALPNWTGASWAFNVASAEGGLEQIKGIYASSGFFRVLGIRPVLGRSFTPEDDRRQGARTVILSDSYWRRRFHADSTVLGKTLEVDTFRGGKFTIVGVMPEGFEFPHEAQIWLSLADWGGGPMPGPDAGNRCCAWYTTLARLKPGVSRERARAELTTIARGISARYPQSSRVTDVTIAPLRETLVGGRRLALYALFGAVGCVLLIGCSNVANLLLSRGVGRRKEMAIRAAIGASRWRIVRQLLVESVLLSSLGAAVGLLLALWGLDALAAALKGRLPLIEDLRMDWAVLAFLAAMTLASGVICGLAPAIELSAVDWRMRSRGENAASKRLRQALVIGEVAIAVVLVAGAGLLVRSFVKVRNVRIGFRTDHILTVAFDTTTSPLRERGQAVRFLENLMPRLAGLPGVRAVAAATSVPLEEPRLAYQAITREGDPLRPGTESPQVTQQGVTPNYFTTMGIALKKGRLFNERDTADGKLVAILNETAARRYWPGEDPIGSRFVIGSLERFGSFRPLRGPETVEWREIVGVVADVRSAGFDTEIQPEVFYNYLQFPLYGPKVVIRTDQDPLSLAAAVRRDAQVLQARAVITDVRTMEQIAEDSVAERRFRALLIGGFSGLALLLGMLGIYSVMSFTVSQRTHEIGIRMALGARGDEVSRMVIFQALRLTAAGLALGLAGSFVAARWISSLLFGVQPTDPVSLAATCALMAASAIAASYLPARRATRVDPAVALRSE
jgi:putative ABC transport system permease protein